MTDLAYLDFLSYFDLRALKDLPSMFTEPIKCAVCKNPIHLSERQIKDRCLYQTSDWTKCLCPSCTDEWKDKRNKDMTLGGEHD